MKSKKLITATSLLIVSALLAACGETADSEQPGSESGGDTSANTEALTLWSTQVVPSSTVSSWEDSPFHAGLADATGIEVDWSFPSEGSDIHQEFNLIVSDTDMPDMMYYQFMGNADQHIDDGVLMDLTELLPEKAPNYWNYLQENPEIDRSMRTDNGRYYMFGFFREDPSQGTFIGPMVRRDWLEELGMDIPTNIEEIEEVIVAFNEEYGARYTFTTGWHMTPGLAGAFGAHGSFDPVYFLDEDQNVQLAQTQPEWRDYMEWMNSLWERGLIDGDVVTLGDQELISKALNEEVGFTSGLGGGIMGTFIRDSRSRGEEQDWIGITYPQQADGSPSAAVQGQNMMIDYGIGITTAISDDQLDQALEWLDWAFTEEGYLYWNFGIEGESYEMVDGEPTYTDTVLEHELGPGEGTALYTGNAGYGLGIQSLSGNQQRGEPASNEAALAWYDDNDEALERLIPMSVTMTSEESREASNIANTVNLYVQEQALGFMTGERSLDEFDNFVQELNDQGLDRLIEIRQGAYERYLAR